MVPRQSSPRLARLTLYSLAGLAVGLAIGLLFIRGAPAEHPALLAAQAITRAWTNAFRLLVVPFVASQLFLALAATELPASRVGRLALLTPVVFLALLLGTFMLSYATAGGLMSVPYLADIRLDPVAAPPPPAGTTPIGASWVDGLIPPNLFAALAGENLLAVMLATAAFALASRRLAAERRGVLERAVRALSEVMFILVEWLIRAAPLVLFALGVASGARSGLRIGNALLGYTVLASLMLLIALGALYPVAAAFGRVSPLRFARAVWPAQLAAAATRSSLATLPLLLAGAESGLRLPRAAAGYVIPLAGALLKLSRGVSEPATLLFLAGALDISLSVGQIVTFTAAMILLTPTPGVPRVTSGTRSLPLYVAVGIPPEYVVLLAATTAVTDILMTVLNSTGYLTAAVLLGGAGRSSSASTGA